MVDGLSGLGQVAEDGVESVETQGAQDVGGSKDSSEISRHLSFLIGSSWHRIGVKDSHDR